MAGLLDGVAIVWGLLDSSGLLIGSSVDAGWLF